MCLTMCYFVVVSESGTLNDRRMVKRKIHGTGRGNRATCRRCWTSGMSLGSITAYLARASHFVSVVRLSFVCRSCICACQFVTSHLGESFIYSHSEFIYSHLESFIYSHPTQADIYSHSQDDLVRGVRGVRCAISTRFRCQSGRFECMLGCVLASPFFDFIVGCRWDEAKGSAN